MTKYVSDTAAAKSLSAYAIMKGRRHVATVKAHHGNSRCLVNVEQDQDAIERCARASKDWLKNSWFVQSASASGYGYDKFTAALAGMWIDGHRMADHCEPGKVPPKGAKVFPADYLPPKGYRLANWSSEHAGWLNCYKLDGLNYLRDLGYTVVQVL